MGQQGVGSQTQVELLHALFLVQANLIAQALLLVLEPIYQDWPSCPLEIALEFS